MADDSFRKITHDEFAALPSNSARLQYLQKWHDFLLSKAASCKEKLGQCSSGITSLTVDDANKSGIVVAYQKGGGKSETANVNPRGEDGKGILSITKGAKTKEGQEYTITYGSKSSTYTFIARSGIMGDGGSYNNSSDAYFDNGYRGWTRRETFVAANAKEISASVSAFDFGLTGLSATVGFLSGTGELCNCCNTGFVCKSEAVNTELTALEGNVSGADMSQKVNDGENDIINNEKNLVEVNQDVNEIENSNLTNSVIGSSFVSDVDAMSIEGV